MNRVLPTSVNWGIERRLEFIEFRLCWEGGVNRSDIVDTFGVSVPQASKDLTLYQERAPSNAIYDKSAKRYVAGEDFKPLFSRTAPDVYLHRLRSLAEGVVEPSLAWIGSMPPTDLGLPPHRDVNFAILRIILDAIRQHSMVEVLYQSMNTARPEPVKRAISPHALGHDGFRWHARAFCHIDQKFKDFLLPRILAAETIGPATISGADDQMWNTHYRLTLGPHPDLGVGQRAAVERDYGMKGGRLEFEVRLSMLFYVLKRLNLLQDASGLNSRTQHIVDLRRDDTEAEMRRHNIPY